MGYDRRKEEPRTKNDENLQTRGLKEWGLIPRISANGERAGFQGNGEDLDFQH